jgi:hypothetical protein
MNHIGTFVASLRATVAGKSVEARHIEARLYEYEKCNPVQSSYAPQEVLKDYGSGTKGSWRIKSLYIFVHEAN